MPIHPFADFDILFKSITTGKLPCIGELLCTVLIYSKCGRLLFYSVNDDDQHEETTLLDNSEVCLSAERHKVSKMKHSGSPFLGAAKGTIGSAKKVTGEMEIQSADMDDGSGRRAGNPCNKAACVRTGLKPRCFVGATLRCHLLFYFFI